MHYGTDPTARNCPYQKPSGESVDRGVSGIAPFYSCTTYITRSRRPVLTKSVYTMILSHSSAIRSAFGGETSLYLVFQQDEDEISATARIWNEAGFLPPRVHRCIVDLLHYSMMEDEIDEQTVFRLVSWYLEVSGYEGDYTIRDPAGLRRFAADYDLPIDRRSDEAIARDVTRAIIAEYGANA